MFIVFLFPSEPAPAAPDMNYTIVVMGGIMVLSLIYYYFPKYGGVNWFTGPVRTVPTTSVTKTPPDTGSVKDSVEDKKGDAHSVANASEVRDEL